MMVAKQREQKTPVAMEKRAFMGGLFLVENSVHIAATPVLKARTLEGTRSRIAGGFLVVLVAATFAVFPKATCAVAAGASPAFVFVVEVRQADMNNA